MSKSKSENDTLLITNLDIIQNISGITTFLETITILIVIHFFPEIYQFRSLIYFSAIGFTIFGYLYYFTPLSRNPNLYMLPYFFFPFSVASVMLILPSVAPFMIFIFFELNTAHALTFGVKKLSLVVLLTTMAITGYFLLQPQYTPIQKLWLIIWLLASFIIYAYRDYRFAQELLNRRTEVEEMRKLTTELKKTHESLSAERNKLSVALAGISDAVIGLDRYQKIILLNTAAERMLNTTRKHALGKHVYNLFKLYEDGEEIDSDEFCPKTVILQDRLIFNKKNLKLVNSSGQEIPVNFSSYVIREAKVANFGCLITIHNISAEKELEEMQLDFVSIAAHELRTPLTSMRGYLALLKDELGNKLSQEHLSFLERASVSADQLSSLVENLLNVSRIDRGALTIQIQPAKWEEIIKNTTESFRELASQKNIKLALKLPTKPLPKVAVDTFRIEEVLRNLLANAITYTSARGEVTVSCWQEGDFVITCVADTGQGIPAAAMKRLFTKF
ncbi:MAG: histidine kinase dimerization/phospho-acceptor domain-containing protein, partial [Nitrososphaerota archaeon]